MIRIDRMEDLEQIRDDPELWREAYGFLSVCAYEILAYGDEEDLVEHQFNMLLLDEEERDYINDLGQSEETILTEVSSSDLTRRFRLLIFPSEIVLIEESLL